MAGSPEPLAVDIVTEFPEMIRGYLGESMIGRASRMGAVRFRIVNPRDFTEDKWHKTDDRPYGGGPGMVMLPDPLVRAVESVREEGTKVLLMTPSGKPFVQADAHRLAREKHLVFRAEDFVLRAIDHLYFSLTQPVYEHFLRQAEDDIVLFCVVDHNRAEDHIRILLGKDLFGHMQSLIRPAV